MLNDLDAIDNQVLNFLQYDARMTSKEIAAKTGKSVTAIYERIRRLEAKGYIKDYVAILDRILIGKKLLGFVSVKLKEHSGSVLSSFENEAIRFHEVMECYRMAGIADFLLKVAIADMDEYNRFLKDRLSALPHVGNVMTSFVLVEAKRTTAYRLSLPHTVL